jgi:phenylacetate-CoA ligase
VILEVVNADGRAVPDGTQGAKILVTNLFNYVQPVIRYELTDLVTMATGSCSCGRTTRRIESIDGRTDDIMSLTDPDGRQVPVHPNHFAEAIEEIAGVHAYQVTQGPREIDIAIVASARDGNRITTAITAGVQRRLAPLQVAHTPLRVRIVDTIARPDSASGKFKLVRARPSDQQSSKAAARPRPVEPGSCIYDC